MLAVMTSIADPYLSPGCLALGRYWFHKGAYANGSASARPRWVQNPEQPFLTGLGVRFTVVFRPCAGPGTCSAASPKAPLRGFMNELTGDEPAFEKSKG
jgi:hypothetical protein